MAESTSNIKHHQSCRSVRVLPRQHPHERTRDAAACGIVPLACEDSEVHLFVGVDQNGVACSTRSSSISAISTIFCPADTRRTSPHSANEHEQLRLLVSRCRPGSGQDECHL